VRGVPKNLPRERPFFRSLASEYNPCSRIDGRFPRSVKWNNILTASKGSGFAIEARVCHIPCTLPRLGTQTRYSFGTIQQEKREVGS
jgi:hypothetical protein